MKCLDRIILKDITHTGTLKLGSFFVQNKCKDNFIIFAKQILDLSILPSRPTS